MNPTIRNIIDYAPTYEMLVVIERLTDLGDVAADIERIKDHLAQASQMEKEAAEHRMAARTEALWLIDVCEAKWSKEEVSKATGYPV